MKSFISWVGGKSRLAASIVKLFPPHRTYVEVFGGAAWVLFRKDPSTSKVEVYNDIHGDLVNLFRVVKHRPSALVECFRLALFSRQTYYWFLKEFDHPVDDEVDRAARFLFLIRSAFGSSIGQGWGFSRTQPAKRLVDPEFLNTVATRLDRVYIDNRSFEKVIALYDSPETLFYLDPPYWTPGERFYQHDFTEADHQRLREILGGVKGRFILSYNDCTAIRKLYKGFKIQATQEIHYSMNNRRNEPRRAREIIVRK